MATISTDANYSAGSYSNNEAFTINQGAKFTIDQSTIDLRNMRCTTFGECLVKNTSTTTPMIVSLGSTGGTCRWQFTAGGISTVEGEWIVLGTGNGTAGQTFNIPQAQGVNGVGTQDVPVIQGLFIDDNDTLRDGSSIPQLCLEVDSASYTNATDHELGGNVFTFDVVAQTVTFKRAVPVGKSVVMPNIIFYTSSNFTGAGEFDLLTSQTGTFNWDKCIWSGKFDYTLTSAKKITFKNCAFNTDLVDKTFGLNSQVEPPLLENVIIKGDCSTVALLSLSNSASAGSFKNLWVDCSHTGGGNPINSQNSSSLYIEKLVATNYLGGTSVAGGNNSRAVISVTSGNSTFYDIYNFIPQQTIYLSSNASNCKVDNVNFQFGSREDATGQTNCGAIRLANCNGNVVTNVDQIKAGPIYPYGNALLCAAGTANNTIANVVLRSGASGSGNNRWNYAANDSGFQNRYNNFVMHGYYKTAFYNNNSASLEAFISNFYAVDQQNEHNVDLRVGARCRIEQLYLNNTQNSGNGNFDQQATASGVDSLSVMGIRNTADGGAIEKTDGLFYLRMSPTEEQTDYFTAVTQTGVIVFNNNNIMYIENSGDVVELESFVHNNVSSISSDLTKQGSTTGSFDVTVKMRRPDGTYTSYVATTQSAMQTAYATLASDAQNRVQFKFRVEKNTTNLTDYLQGLRFEVTLTGDDYPFVLDPGIINVEDGGVYSVDAGTKFLVDTSVVTTFTIDGIIPKEIELTGVGSTTVLGVNNAKLTTTNITGTGTLVRGDGLNPSTNWSVASNVLTLSGTEGDLLGLRGLAEVDYADAGGKIVYTVNNLTRIVIDSSGDLTIDSDVEQLVCGVTPASHVNTLTVLGSGRLQVGKAKVVGGFTIYSSGPALVFNNDSSNPNFTVSDSWANLELISGSRLDWYGGEIQSVGLLLPKPGSQFRTYSKEAMFVSVPSKLQFSRPEAYIRMQTSDQIIDGFVNKFGILLMIGKPTSFSGYEPISSGSAIDMSNQSTPSSFYDFADLVAGKGNTRDVGGKSNTWVRLLNTNLGSDITVTSQNSSESNSQTYLVESRKGVIFNFSDENGAIIQGAKLYMVDTDNGSRLAANQVGSNASYTADRVYTGTSNALGTIDLSALADSILLSLHYSTNSSGNPVYDIFDSRGNNNDNTDLFTFKSMSYLQTIGSVTLELKGLGSLTQSQVLITDFSITETNRATVQAYTLLNTAQQVYDFAKSYLYDNYAGELATIIGRSGSQVELAGKTLVINATSSAVFAYSNPTITIKASTYTGGATATTGSVTTQNGALLNGGTFDCDVDYQSGANTTITGVTINGTLDFNTAGTYTLDACSVSQVTNSSGGTVNITLINNATVTTNTGPNINITVPKTIRTTVVDSTFTPIQDARVYLKETSGGAVVLNALTDSSGIAQTTVAYTADKAIDGWVRKSTAPATIYKQFTLAGTLTSNGLELTAIMTEDV